MPIADATRVGVGLPNVVRALGLQAGQPQGLDLRTAVPGEADPALAMLRRLLESLAAQKQNAQPVSVGLAPLSVNVGLPPTGPSSVGEARDLLHRAGLI